MQQYIIFFLLALFGSASFAGTDPSHNIKHKLVRTRQHMGKVHSDLAIKQRQSKQLLQQLQAAEQATSREAKELYGLEQALRQEQQRYQAMLARLAELDIAYKSSQQVLSKQIKLTYQLGSTPQIKFFLGNYQPAELARLLVYYEYIHKQQQAKLATTSAMLAETTALQSAIAAKIAGIKQKKIEKSKQVSKLKLTKHKQAQLLAQIKQAISKNERTLSILQRDEKSLESKVAQLQRQNRQQTKPTVGMSNKAIFDQFSPHQPIIRKTARIRMRSISAANANRFLIQAEPGTNVHAVNDGRVIFAAWMRGYGLLLIIQHSNDLMSLYGHNQTLLKKVGDKVSRGEIIALVGQSGGQMLSGLYFEIRKAAKSIDLRNWFGYETT